MIYNAGNPIDIQRAEKRFNALIKEQKVFELTEKASKVYSQNNYLHLIINYLAIETGESPEYVKKMYYKIGANRDLFAVFRNDKFLGEVNYLRETSTLTKEEKTLSIDNFRAFSLRVCNVYLPEANEEEFMKNIVIEINRNTYAKRDD